MNQVTNLKSLGFTWERIANLLGVFPEVILCDIDFSGFFDVAFDPHISSIVRFVVDRVAKLVLFVSVAEADDSPAPTLRSSLLSPLLPLPLILGNSLKTWLLAFSHFAMFTATGLSSLGHSHYSFYSNALATGCLYCLNELTACQVCVMSESKPK